MGTVESKCHITSACLSDLVHEKGGGGPLLGGACSRCGDMFVLHFTLNWPQAFVILTSVGYQLLEQDPWPHSLHFILALLPCIIAVVITVRVRLWNL